MKQYIIPGIFLAGTLFFGILYVVGPPQPGKVVNLREEASEGAVQYNRIEQFKKETEVKMEIRKQQAQMEKRVARPELDPGFAKRNRYHETPINRIGNTGAAATELHNPGVNEAMNLDQRMDAFLAKLEDHEQMDKIQRAEYVKKVIAEAEKMGFKVEVDDDMNIKNIQKLK